MKSLFLKFLLVFVLVASIFVMGSCTVGGGNGNGNGSGNGTGEGGGEGEGEGGGESGGNGETGALPENFYLNLFTAPETLGSLKVSIKDLDFAMPGVPSEDLEAGTTEQKTITATQGSVAEFVVEFDETTGAISGGFKANVAILNGIMDGIVTFDVAGIIENTTVYIEYAAEDGDGNAIDDYTGITTLDLMELVGSMMGGGMGQNDPNAGYPEGGLDVPTSSEEFEDDFEYGDDYVEEGGMSTAMQMIPVILEQLKPFVEQFVEANDTTINDILGKIVNLVFSVNKTADGYVIAFDCDKLIALNEDMATLTLEALFDKYFGEGSLLAVKDALMQVLDLKLSEVPAFLSELGFATEDLFTAINGIAAMMGAEGFDINLYFTAEDYKDMKIGTMIAGDETYAAEINEGFTQIKGVSLYTLMDAGEDAKEELAAILNTIKGKVSIALTTDANGAVNSLTFALDELAPEEGIKVSVTVTVELNKTMDLGWKEDFLEKFDSDAAA